MKLYHGTSEAVARASIVDGLLPRCETGLSSNWTEHPSRDDLVYLTTAYAGHFGICAMKEGDTKFGVVEIDVGELDEWNLFPDEDFMEQATRGLEVDWNPSGDMAERTTWFRENLENFGHHWTDSVEGLGNCAHLGEISPYEISRVCIVDMKARSELLYLHDPTISLLNYKICGGMYRILTDWFFAELDESRINGDLFMRAMFNSEVVERLRDRSGLELLI